TFPMIVGVVLAICGMWLAIRPDEEQVRVSSAGKLLLSVVVLLGYAYTLRPVGFLIPTAIASGIVSYQISPRLYPAMATGAGLSVGLFVLFKFVLGLGLFALPRAWTG
ncbi:MAG: tripartite tricarboxylate transporter TctB family protein, partial [Alphaproteobacteria bacterium]